MSELLFCIASLALGAAVAWIIAGLRCRTKLLQAATELNARIAAADATIGEVRAQLVSAHNDLSQLRAKLDIEAQSRAATEGRLQASLDAVTEQRKLFADAEAKFKDAFAALSAHALQHNNAEFTKQAEEKMKPLRDALERYEKQIRDMDTKSTSAYAGVRQLVESVGRANEGLAQQTTKLVTALRTPHVRGRWGEITLQRVVELAGMSPHCDFTPQTTLHSESGPKRPDLIIRLPQERCLVVDAKTPLTAYLEAVDAPDESARLAGLNRHADAVRAHMRSLALREYWSQLEATPDFVVMFIPGESFFSAALEQDRNLIEDGYRQRIILATPSTLLALLRTVAHCWQERDVAENAQRIAATGRELYERIVKFAEHLARIGDGLRKATDAYNNSVNSWQSRVLPSGRRMLELGVSHVDSPAPALTTVDSVAVSVDHSLVDSLF